MTKQERDKEEEEIVEKRKRVDRFNLLGQEIGSLQYAVKSLENGAMYCHAVKTVSITFSSNGAKGMEVEGCGLELHEVCKALAQAFQAKLEAKKAEQETI